METGTTQQTELTPRVEFWRGILVGTMGGMVLAAWAYSIFDRLPQFLKPSKSGPQLIKDKAA